MAILAVSPGAAQQQLPGAPRSFRGVEDPADAFGAPPNRTVCPRTKPFECENGDCVTNPTKCALVRSCSADKPLRCADGTCVREPFACNAGPACPRDRPYRCPDGSCAVAKRECHPIKEEDGDS